MREILFKAKRKDNGKWVEGYYYKMWENHYILWGMNNDKPDMIEIDPETLCQYTGATDRHDNKIWEHDVVEYTDEKGIIQWVEGESAFMVVFDGWIDYLGEFYSFDLDVIENRFSYYDSWIYGEDEK